MIDAMVLATQIKKYNDVLATRFKLEDFSPIIGNGCYESYGFTELHEIGLPDNKGGIGIHMWTGKRRLQYEAYCDEYIYHPLTFDAGVRFALAELAGSYAVVIRDLRKAEFSARPLSYRVQVVETWYEGAGIVREANRVAWAERVLNILK